LGGRGGVAGGRGGTGGERLDGWAACSGGSKKERCRCTEDVVGEGAKVEAMSAGCPTILGEATSRGNIEIVKVCLEFGADPRKLKWAPESPLASAVGKGSQELLNFMLNAIGRTNDMQAQARE
jgi:hypothetical protein